MTPNELKEATALLQAALDNLGYPVGNIDGIYGPKTRGGVLAYVEAGGKPGPGAHTAGELPWVTLAKTVYGLHEIRDKKKLTEFLKSDGALLGDPSVYPWCGDFAETCIKRTLPDEVFPGALGVNPYWARNWALLGEYTEPTYGCILSFERETGGHVAICLGHDGDKNFIVLGGNQSNTVSVTKIEKSRMLPKGSRWPSTFERRPIYLPKVTIEGAVSTNEA
jgi:uncharacterized protein (TIGR02594 family)